MSLSELNTPPGWPDESDWTQVLSDCFGADWFQELTRFVAEERSSNSVFPPVEDVFNAFRHTSFKSTRAVILGQDPYHGAGQAHGLSFSVREGIKIPPSLRNIYKELTEDLTSPVPTSGDLSHWADQGVLLLNTVLTVRESEANSHQKKGWETFTDIVIRSLNDHPEKIVFILWGKPAEKKRPLISERHSALCSPHPSPLSARRGFFGSRPFSRTNEILLASGRPTIDWIG